MTEEISKNSASIARAAPEAKLGKPEKLHKLDKRLLRQQLLISRKNFSETRHKASADLQFLKQILAELETRTSQCLGFYWATQAEFDPLAAVMQWLEAHPDCQAALPVVTDHKKRKMEFRRWTPASRMVEGAYGIRVPEPAETSETCLPDTLLIPCLGATRDRYRLGYGAGFYDCYLSAAQPRPYSIGLAYNVGLLPDFPDNSIFEAHDWVLDKILTEDSAY